MSKGNDAITIVKEFEVKLRNKRVRGMLHKNGDVGLYWKRLDEAGYPSVTRVRLSNEAALATTAVLYRLLNLGGK